MFELYTADTPNSHKVTILLEELGMAYHLKPVNIFRGEQFQPELLRLNPHHQTPFLVNGTTGEVVCESGAILLYLAEQSGKFLPLAQRPQVWQWLFFEASTFGPTLRRLGLTRRKLGHLDAAVIDVPKGEAQIYAQTAILESALTQEFMLGEYSIVDMALWPWLRVYGRLGLSLDEYPRLQAWVARLGARPSVQKGLHATALKATSSP